MAAEDVRLRGDQPAQAAQQVGAAVQPDQRIVVRDLHAAREVGDVQIRELVGIGAQRLEADAAEKAPAVNIARLASPNPSERPMADPVSGSR